jgi:hypothetical protein
MPIITTTREVEIAGLPSEVSPGKSLRFYNTTKEGKKEE